MIEEYKVIVNDLKNYLINGIQEDSTAISQNGTSFDSTVINNIKYQFIINIEDVSNISDPSIIPVLLVTYPDQYLNGRLLFNNQFIDMRTMLVKTENTTGIELPKINFFIIPHIFKINEGNFGSIFFDLKLDYVTDFDTYGFMSKEIDSILKNHYYRPCCGKYHSVKSSHTELFFIPETQRILNQESIINRISQIFNIRFCKLV